MKLCRDARCEYCLGGIRHNHLVEDDAANTVRVLPSLPAMATDGEWSIRIESDRTVYAAHPASPLLVLWPEATEWAPVEFSGFPTRAEMEPARRTLTGRVVRWARAKRVGEWQWRVEWARYSVAFGHAGHMTFVDYVFGATGRAAAERVVLAASA